MPIVNLAGHDADQGIAWVRWTFDLGPDMVWLGLTDPVWIRRWLGTPLDGFAVGEYTGLGDHVRILHAGGQIQSSSVLGCEVWSRLEVSWAFPDEAVSVVDVKLAPIAPAEAHSLDNPDLADVLAADDEADAELGEAAAGAEASRSGTELTLTHTGIGDQAREYAIGWHTHLLYLAAALRAAPMALDRFWDVHERVARAYY